MRIQVIVTAITAVAALAAQTRASGVAAMEPLLARIATYQYGDDPEPATQLTEFVAESLGSPGLRTAIEARLLTFLESDATMAGKNAAFRELSLIGTDASVPVLARLLAGSETAEMARYALAAIPGAAAGAALRKSLDQAPNDRVRAGVISSLGQRKDAQAVPTLAALLSSANPEISVAAAAALAGIPDRRSLAALEAATRGPAGQVRELMAEAYVTCADRFADRGQKGVAATVYKQMLAAGEPARIRTRALAGLAAAQGSGAVPVLRAEIESNDVTRQAAGIGLLNAMPGPAITAALISELPKLSPSGQVHLLTALAHRGDAAARPAVSKALTSGSPEVRAAALGALGKLGDESSVMTLAQAAANTRGAEQKAARRSLYTLRGPATDGAIVSAIASTSGKVKTELIVAAGERGAAAAAGSLTSAAREDNPEVRRAALRALRTVGGSPQTPALLDVLLKASSASERRDATQTLAAIIRRSQPAPVGVVLSAYRDAPARDSRLSLLEVMGQTSSDEALPLLRDRIKDADPEIARAAILALTEWDSPAPLMDLMSLAKSATGNLQVLALRGVLKLMVLRSDRPASESARMLGEVMAVSNQNAEKLTALSLLPYFPSKESLQVAQDAQRDPVLAKEAKLAWDQVSEALKLR